MNVSVVLPAYNEEQNIEPMLEEAIDVLPSRLDEVELIVVDDGSDDETATVVERIASEHPVVRLHRHAANKGYGAALRSGFLAAAHDWTFFTDADRQFRLEDIDKLLPHAGSYDIVTGYRANRQDPAIRRLYARCWNALGRQLFGFSVRDVNCAFKLFRTDVVRNMPLLSTGALINTEIFARATNRRLRVKEVPVRHFPRPTGTPTGGNVAVIVRAFYELFSLRAKLSNETTAHQSADGGAV